MTQVDLFMLFNVVMSGKSLAHGKTMASPSSQGRKEPNKANIADSHETWVGQQLESFSENQPPKTHK